MSEEVYKAARLLRSLKSAKVRGAKQPVKRTFDPPSALGTSSPGVAKPEWVRSHGSPGPESFMTTQQVRSARGLEGRPAERARAVQLRSRIKADMSRKPPRYV